MVNLVGAVVQLFSWAYGLNLPAPVVVSQVMHSVLTTERILRTTRVEQFVAKVSE
jgi:hypothetical protein